jgi:hypothetical protein
MEDLGVFNGRTGELEAGIEAKLKSILGNIFEPQEARQLFNQGVAYMAGRDLDFMVNVTSAGFYVLWRKDLPEADPATGGPRSQYYLWPDREFAGFHDDSNVETFQRIIGEFARITARKTLEVLPKISPAIFAVPAGDAHVPVSVLVRGTTQPSKRAPQQARGRNTSRHAVTRRGDVVLHAYDLGTHMTVEDFKEFMADADSEAEVMDIEDLGYAKIANLQEQPTETRTVFP